MRHEDQIKLGTITTLDEPVAETIVSISIATHASYALTLNMFKCSLYLLTIVRRRR